MVWNNFKGLLAALFCVTLLLCLLDAKEFRYKRYTFRKKQRLVSICFFNWLTFVNCGQGENRFTVYTPLKSIFQTKFTWCRLMACDQAHLNISRQSVSCNQGFFIRTWPSLFIQFLLTVCDNISRLFRPWSWFIDVIHVSGFEGIDVKMLKSHLSTFYRTIL